MNDTINTGNENFDEISPNLSGDERRARLARLASAAFFMGAIALVNPALAEECSDTADMVRTAARDDTLAGDKMHTLERAVDNALSHHARGDEFACRLEITLLRQTLSMS
ncbi:MAG: hypothetical protein LJE67_09765 [Salaquimonas sp.]|jgi:hypothetical protein|nr:hypothetical protein [Salaquimonas sp.]